MCRIIHKPWSAKHALLARNSSRPLFQNTLSSPEIARAHYISKHALLARNRSRGRSKVTSSEIAPAHYLGRSKVTLLSPTLSTQTQAEKPIGKGRTVTPPHISNKCVRKTWFHSPPNPPPHSYLMGAKSPSPRKLPSPEPRNLSPSSMAPPPHQFHSRPPP